MKTVHVYRNGGLLAVVDSVDDASRVIDADKARDVEAMAEGWGFTPARYSKATRRGRQSALFLPSYARV